MNDVTGAPSPVPHFPRVSAADRADGSVEILAQGESRVFSPMPGRGSDDARLRALRHLHETAAGLGRPIRITTWTLDRSRASIVVTPAGECYDEARPHSSFVIPQGSSTSVGASPAPDIPAAIRPWGLDLPPASPVGGGRTHGQRRTGLIVAGALALLLLWSGVVAVLLTTGHQDSASAGQDDLKPTPTPTAASTTPTGAPRTTAPVPTHSALPVLAVPVAPHVVVTPLAAGRLQIVMTGLGGTTTRPVTARVRVAPAGAAEVDRTVRAASGRAVVMLTGLPAGRAQWLVSVPGAKAVQGRATVLAPRPPAIPPRPTPTPSGSAHPPTVIPPAPPAPSSHHATHHTTHHHTSSPGGGHLATQPTGGSHHTHHHQPASNPSNPVNPVPGRSVARARP